MSILLRIRGFAVYLVLGCVYDINHDAFQRSCIRLQWRYRRVFGLGPAVGE